MTKPTKDQIKRFYADSLARCLDVYSRIEDKEWSKKASDHWSAREHLAYNVAALEDQSIPLTRKAIAGEPGALPGFERRDQERDFDRKTTAAISDLPVTDLLARLEAAVAEHIQILDGLSESDLDKPASDPGWDRPGTLRDLYFAAYLLLPNQYQAIRRVAKKKVPHWAEAGTPEQTNYHMSRLFHFMPLIFRSDTAEDMQATYQFVMEGDGGGQWSLHIGDRKAVSADGPAESFDTEIRTKPALWMDLASGDLNPPIAIATRKVKLGGNPMLAFKLSGLFGGTG